MKVKNYFFRYGLILLTLVGSSLNLYAQDFIVLQENDTLYGKINISYRLFHRDIHQINVGIRIKGEQLKTFSACQIKEVKKRNRHFIVRSYEGLGKDCSAYRVELDGPVKVFDCDLNDSQEIYCVELPNGQFFPITEKIYYKWVLPYYLENPSFKAWYEELNVFFPRRKKDVLGGKGQPKVNRFIYKMTQNYNEFAKQEGGI